MLPFRDPNGPGALNRRETLYQYLGTRRRAPEVLDDAAYEALSDVERAQHDRARLSHLSGGILLNTRDLHVALRTLDKCMAANISRDCGHTGMMLSGNSTLGKTTILKALMRRIYNDYTKMYADYSDDGRVPVVYIEVPAGSNGKRLIVALAHFFGMTVKPAESRDALQVRVVEMLARAKTEVIIVDEFQNLSPNTRGNGETVDVLKQLHNDVNATFVYSGINLDKGQILADWRGAQVGGRFAMVHVRPYNLSAPEDRALWKGLIADFEKALPLRHHPLGTLPAMHEYLHQRTGGRIGSLGRLLIDASIEAIKDPSIEREELTKPLLDAQVIDWVAEQGRHAPRRAPKPDATPEATVPDAALVTTEKTSPRPRARKPTTRTKVTLPAHVVPARSSNTPTVTISPTTPTHSPAAPVEGFPYEAMRERQQSRTSKINIVEGQK